MARDARTDREARCQRGLDADKVFNYYMMTIPSRYSALLPDAILLACHNDKLFGIGIMVVFKMKFLTTYLCDCLSCTCTGCYRNLSGGYGLRGFKQKTFKQLYDKGHRF